MPAPTTRYTLLAYHPVDGGREPLIMHTFDSRTVTERQASLAAMGFTSVRVIEEPVGSPVVTAKSLSL